VVKIVSWKNIRYGKLRVRRNYAKVQTDVELPNLIEIQTKSFEWFKTKGIQEVFDNISPITDYNKEKFELSFVSFEFDEPKYTIKEAKIHKTNYCQPLKANVYLINKDTGEFKEDIIFMGDVPMMTPWGTFIINGSERVIVTQIVRSAGAFFSREMNKKTGKYNYSGLLMPTHGAWIEFELGSKNIWYAKVDRCKKVPLTVLIRALGIGKTKAIKDLFGTSDFLENTLDADETFGEDDAVKTLYDKIKPNNPISVDSVRNEIASLLFEHHRYDLAKVGRYKVNKKLDVVQRALGNKLVEDLKDADGNILIHKDVEIREAEAKILSEHREAFRVTKEYDLMLRGNSVTLEILKIKVRGHEDKIIPIIGNDQREDTLTVTLSDIIASISYYMNLHDGVGRVDDIDHLGNRRLRLIGELLQNQFKMGLQKVETQIKQKMSTSNDTGKIQPINLVNVKPLTSQLREFFGSSQLSQFMDQINPLSELTHKRRLSALGEGGISRDRAGFEVRDVHDTHYGRICPVETPEGQNIGLISSLAVYAKANEYGFITTPYLVVKNNKNTEEYKNGIHKAVITKELKYLTADEEEDFIIAQANVNMETRINPETNEEEVYIVDDKIIARKAGEFIEKDKMDVDLIDVSPKQIVAVSTACIPFLEHDDPTRGLMGANMQRQAIPLLKPEAPFVGTGIEYKAAKDSGVCVVADVDGVVEYADGSRIILCDNDGIRHIYELNKYERSNNSTCNNQRPIVHLGEEIKKGDILADGPSMEQGELALGRNVVIAFMTWNGYNFEDAVIMSERLVQDDVYTSIHIEEYQVEVRDTPRGKEEITATLEGEDSSSIVNLDSNGIVRIGAFVKEGDTLVGKTTPKGQTEPTPEERLTQALFEEKAKDRRITSLKVPHGGGGIVGKVEHFTRKDGVELPPSVNEVVRVYIVQKRKITVGDKMSGRHGNKGVISNILPVEDMPYMEDGTPIDIMLNPQGVPSRMNIGQVLEIHLGLAAKKLGLHVVTPVFDGLTIEDLKEIMNEARESDLALDAKGSMYHRSSVDENGKMWLYDGRTGRRFDSKISVGVMYMIKLAHMVDDKLHARNIGPYTLVTQQPMGGKAQNGGQRFGEMEVWALEAYGAAHTLQEMMTIKSDDMVGRNKVNKAIIDGAPIPESGIPESFRVLIKELQGLGLSVKLIDKDGNDVANKSLVKDIQQAQKERQG